MVEVKFKKIRLIRTGADAILILGTNDGVNYEFLGHVKEQDLVKSFERLEKVLYPVTAQIKVKFEEIEE